MSELTLFLIRIAYLAILWIFVLSAISVIRSDMFGARAPEASRSAARGNRGSRGGTPKPAKAPSKRRGSPTHVLVTEGANTGERADLDQAPILIGRGSDAAIRKATALPAMTCSSGPPCWPGKTAESIFFAYSSRHRISPPRAPPIVLCTVLVTTSA